MKNLCGLTAWFALTVLGVACSTQAQESLKAQGGYASLAPCDPSLNVSIITFRAYPPYSEFKDPAVMMCVNQVTCYPMIHLKDHTASFQNRNSAVPKDAALTAYEDLGGGKKGRKLDGTFDFLAVPDCALRKSSSGK